MSINICKMSIECFFVHDFEFHLLWWSHRVEEMVCCVELLVTRGSSGQVTAALVLCLVRLILHWYLLYSDHPTSRHYKNKSLAQDTIELDQNNRYLLFPCKKDKYLFLISQFSFSHLLRELIIEECWLSRMNYLDNVL